ncbi:hypothetical protein Ddc_11624 [Ditylenchus destructor]|nr:hypothetical protein Ddc_11624 [Ditylenchus destructor]
MLPAYVLLDILKCLDRDRLEKIQVTNRAINGIIEHDFVTKPLRLLPDSVVMEAQVQNGKLLLSIRRGEHRQWTFYSNECFVPQSREWLDDSADDDCKHTYPIDVMRPFLNEKVLFKQVFVVVNDDTPDTTYNLDHIAALESISHVWSGQMLRITSALLEYKPGSFGLMFSNSAIMQCRILQLSGCCYIHYHQHDNGDFGHYSNMYAVPVIEYLWDTNGELAADMIREKTAFPKSETTIVLSTYSDEADSIFEAIRQEFLKSTSSCRLRVLMKVFHIPHNTDEDNLDFYLENAQTNEALQAKQITEQEIKEKLNLSWPKIPGADVQIYMESAWLLERFPL